MKGVPNIDTTGSVIIRTIDSTTDPNKRYTVTIDKIHNYVSCTCTGFLAHGRCKHIKFYFDLIEKTLYPNIKPSSTIQNLKFVKNKVKQVLLKHPEILETNNYEILFFLTGKMFPEIQDKKTTIERMYRDLKKFDEDIIPLIPVDTQIKSEKEEQIMHQVMTDPTWKPSTFKSISSDQSLLFNDGEGVEK